MLWCVLRMFFTANTICEHLGYCDVVEYVCVVCGVFVQTLCQCNVWVVCLCKSVVGGMRLVLCVGVCLCVHVLFGCVVICSCAVWCWCSWCVCVCLSVVVCHSSVFTTLHMKTPTNSMILVFRTKQTSGGSKVKEHPRFSFTVQLSCGP